MEIKVLFNNESINKKLAVGWGVSFIIDNRILFDTGEKAEYLFDNMKIMNIDISCLDVVVISHDHWDHTGGLWQILKERKGLRVYGCPGFSREFKEKAKSLAAEFIAADKRTEIDPLEIARPAGRQSQGLSPGNSLNSTGENIYITGEIPGSYNGQYMAEQALVIKTENGISVITGCAHPGVVEILERVKEEFPDENFYFVGGGFHLINADKRLIDVIAERFKEMGVRKAGPTHCSGKEAEGLFKEKYGDSFIEVKAGKIIEV